MSESVLTEGVTRIEAPVTRTLVIDELLHDGGVVVFRGHTGDGMAVRSVARRAVMRAPAPGETWTLAGSWQTHHVHGHQFGVTAATLVRPSGRLFVQAVARNTREFPGIGFALAQRVWDAYGDRVFDLLDAGDPVPFVDRVGLELAHTLVAGWHALNDETKAYRWLTHHGFPVSLAAKVVAIYSAVPVPAEHSAAAARIGRVVWHLESDPYRLLAFAGWKATDAAARRLGLTDGDDRRLVGAVEAACAKWLAESHTWIAPDELRAAAGRLLQLPRCAADRAINLAVQRRAVVEHAGGYQAPGTYVMERFIADRCSEVREGRYVPDQLRLEQPLTRNDATRVLDAYERREGYALSAAQREAVWMAVTEPVSLLLGGPGVGKTTVLKAVHAVAGAAHRTVHQAALSGRAAQRMAEATGRPASTIAALLIRIDQGEVTLDDEPLVVIDEASMVDLATLYRLLRRFPPGVRLLLVGDPGQLPPIGFGLTFHVLADDAAVPRTTLSEVRRQTEASGIPAVCAAVRNGHVPELAGPDWARLDGVCFIDAAPSDVTQTVVDVLSRLGPSHAAQVVGSVKRGPGAVDEINGVLQRLRGMGKAQLNGRFFPGDPVIVTVNDYELGVMNGELGTALSNADGGGLLCSFDSGDKVVTALGLQNLDLAYAITCHKAQGSQFPTVIVPITRSRLLDRTLLLTAISRAQRQVVLVGDWAAFAEAVTAPPGPSLRQVGLGR